MPHGQLHVKPTRTPLKTLKLLIHLPSDGKSQPFATFIWQIDLVSALL
jgi:hypothetical protein